MNSTFHEVVHECDDLVASIEKLDVNERHGLVHVKARLVLIDGSDLHVSEVWIDSSLEKYSYYWLEETGETIVGWDNTPHHEEVETFPTTGTTETTYCHPIRWTQIACSRFSKRSWLEGIRLT